MSRWQRIEQLFLAASELTPAERGAFLEQEAAGDLELRSAVEGMLRHAGLGDSLFHAAVAQAAPGHAASTEIPPAQIGRYSIVRELGRGGMGAVYLAERTDREFHQQVAIKVVKRGMDTAQIVERFRHERRILASLDHPNIARLLDGGTTAEGSPFLVMEYVEGRPLADYCREHNLPIRARLLLFEQVCAAVQHAHHKLIVHRDIKPANILVTPAGVPKLLDFGIAKLLLPDDTESPAEAMTRAGARLLTPDYAAPEQVRGEPVSVATDVFSLGAVLYELLTGRRAHQFKTYSDPEFVRVICETEVTPPSQVVPDARLGRQLAGDLDNIVGLALRKDPARRYVSVEQFAGDVRRYLEGRPVTARPESLRYRVHKFVNRNRVPVAAVALLVMSLALGIVATVAEARRADAQAAKAERRFQQVRKLANTFVFDVYDGMATIPGTAKLRADVVATALQYLDSLASEAEDDRALQAELAAAYRRIGDVQGNPALSGLGQTPAALASYQKALAILGRLTKGDADPKTLAELGNLHRTTGFVWLSSGDARRAIEHQRSSIAAFEKLRPRRGEDIEVDTRIAQAWGIMGKALSALGDASAAVERHTAAVNTLRQWLPRKTLPTTLGTLSIFLFDLAEARRDTGDLRGGVETLEESVRIRREVLARDPSNLNSRRRLFSLNFALAAVHAHPFGLHLGDQASAERYAGEALREAERMAAEDKGSDRSVRDLMFGNWIQGCVLLNKDARSALPYLEAAVTAAAAQARAGDADVLHDEVLANAQEALGRALVAASESGRGLDLLRKAAATMESMTAQAPQIVDYRTDFIRAAHQLGDVLPPAEAAEFYRKAFATAEKASPSRSVRELMSRAEVDLRWPRWNADAPAAERRQRLERAAEAWRQLAGYAPGNRYVALALAEARRILEQMQ